MRFHAALAIATAAQAGTALAILLLPRGSIGLAHTAICALATATFAAVSLVALHYAGVHVFALLHFAWLDVWLVPPLAGLGLLLATRWREVTLPARICALLALAPFPLGLHAVYVEPFDLRLESATVPLRPRCAGVEPVTVGVLADIQSPRVTEHEREAVARLMALTPDVVLVPGDVWASRASARDDPAVDDFRALFASISAPGGVWVVRGNTDRGDGLAWILEGTGARLLRDEVVRVRVKDRTLRIYGLDERRYQDSLAAFESAEMEGDVVVVLVHRPSAVMQLRRDSRVDLVVGGHTHGGQVVLPFVGPPIVLSPLPRRIAAGGLHELDGNRVYVSRGLGMERGHAPQIRFLCPPEITLLTLSSGG